MYFWFLGVHIEEDLTWSISTKALTKKAQQRLYFPRILRKNHLTLAFVLLLLLHREHTDLM